MDDSLALLPSEVTPIKGIYDNDYVNAVFWLWYDSGKPGANKLRSLIDPPEGFGIPGVPTIYKWIDDFKIRAEPLDRKISEIMETKAVTKKVEMLTRHAEIGNKMQSIAMEYLQENSEKINANIAVKLLVEGIRIERESLGLPTLITATQDATDEKLMSEIQRMLGESGMDISGFEELGIVDDGTDDNLPDLQQ